MTIEELQQKIIFFNEKPQFIREGMQSLHEKIFFAYNQWVFHKVNAIIELSQEPSQLAQHLQVFLLENWSLVKETYLCPTSIPTADVTLLLCSVAEFAAANMPLADKQLAPLNLLMPTVGCEFFRDSYPSLNEIPINTVLTTHILGREGLFLFPIQLLNEMNIDHPETWSRLPNPYYSGEEADKYYLTEEERCRLISHNSKTRFFGEALNHYEKLSHDRGNLLGQLQLLYRSLRSNNAYSGRGTDENAGLGVYIPIVEFHNYYMQLGPASRNQIPQNLAVAIHTLLNLASDPELNSNATENITTCIADRGAELAEVMHYKEGLLAEITIDQEQAKNLVTNAKAKLRQARDELNAALEHKSFTDGRDCLPLSLELFTRLNVPLAVNSLTDLNALQMIDARELEDILRDSVLRVNIIKTLGNLENLIINLTELSLDKIYVFLRSCANELLRYFIRNSSDLNALLRTFSFEKTETVCQSLQEHLPRILVAYIDVTNSCLDLTPKQCDALYQSIYTHLPNTIHTLFDFDGAYKQLNSPQREEFCQVMLPKLTRMIRGATDFDKVLNYLNPDLRTIVYESKRVELLSIIKTASDFGWALRSLNVEQRTQLYEQLQDKLPSMIKKATDFGSVLCYLNTEQRTAVYLTMQPWAFIEDSFDLGIVLCYLNPEQCLAVCQQIRNRLSTIIDNAYNFTYVLRPLDPLNNNEQPLPPEQNAIVSREVRSYLPKIIKSPSDFRAVFHYLSQEQCITVCQDLQVSSPNLLKNVSDLTEAFISLNAEKCAAVCQIMQATLIRIINNTNDFVEVIERIHPQQCTYICQALIIHPSNIIGTPGVLNLVLRRLTPEQCTTFCHALKTHLSMIIRTPFDYINQLLCNLTPEQRAVVSDIMLDHLRNIIKSSRDFQDVFTTLTPKQQTIIFEAMRGSLPALIKTSHDFNNVLTHLNQGQCAVLCQLMLARLPDLIDTANVFVNVFKSINGEQHALILAKMQVKFQYIIRSKQDLNETLNCVSPDNGGIIVCSLAQRVTTVTSSQINQHLWDLPLEADHGKNEVDSSLLRAAQLLNDVAINPRRVNFFQPNRPDDAVNQVVNNIKSGNITDVESLKNHLILMLLNTRGYDLPWELIDKVGFIISKLEHGLTAKAGTKATSTKNLHDEEHPYDEMGFVSKILKQ